MKVSEALKAISYYPINTLSLTNIAEECGLQADTTVNADVRASKPFVKAKAKVYIYLSEAPNVVQAGAQYSFTDEERAAFRRKAAALLEEIGEEDSSVGSYGYLGEDI